MPALVKTAGNLVSPLAADMIGRAIRPEFDALGKTLADSIREDSPESFKKSIKSAVAGQGLNMRLRVYSNDPDYQWIEEGRKPGKQPPPAVMLAWVKKKGLGAKAFSIKTRKPLKVGIVRTRNRATGKQRTRAQSLLAIQKSIAFLIGRAIGREGLPRHTGFKPKHALGLFNGLRQNHAPEIEASYARMGQSIASILNG